MKKIILVLFLLFCCGIANANIHVDFNVAKSIIMSQVEPNYQKSVITQYNTELEKGTPVGTLSAPALSRICDAAGWDKKTTEGKQKRQYFTRSLINKANNYTYFEVCGKDKDNSDPNKRCIDNVFNNIDVQKNQALAIAKEYILIKYKDEAECSDKTRPGTINPNNDYVKCTSKFYPVYYEFKFDDVNESSDTTIYKDTIKAIGIIHGVSYKSPAGAADLLTLERIQSLGCDVGYDTKDVNVCEKINKSLKQFGLQSKVENVGCGSLNNSEVFCAASISSKGKGCGGYNIDEKVFKEVQYPLSPTLENYVKDYVTTQLKTQNISVNSFSCLKLPKTSYKKNGGFITGADNTLFCNVNDKGLCFEFDDLSETANYSKNAGLSRLACIQNGGIVDKKNCRGLKEQECTKLGTELKKQNQTFGTRYDKVRGGCILNAATAERGVNFLGEVAAGIALTLVTDGAATIPVIVSIGTDLVFEGVEDWKRKIPYKDYKEFLKTLNNCSETSQDPLVISRTNTVETKYCLSWVVKEYYKLIVGEMSLLAPEDQSVLSEVFANIIENIGDAEYIKRASESDISIFKQARNHTSEALLLGLFLFHPEKAISKFDDVAKDIARLRYSASKNFTQHLNDFKYTGKTTGLPIQRLTKSEWQTLNKSLSSDGIEMFEQNGYMWFRKIGQGVDIENLLKSFRKSPMFRPASSNSLGRDYYRIMINDGDNVDEIIDVLQRNGYYVSSNTTTAGEKFIGASKENVFGPWDNLDSNWLKKRTATNASKQAAGKIIGNKRYFDNNNLANFLRRDEPLTLGKIKGHDVFIDPKDFGQVADRPIILVSLYDRKIPFYISTGTAGKISVPTGKWEFFGGIDTSTGWFNKGGLDDILDHYGVPEFRQIANMLDSRVGDLRNVEYIAETQKRAAQGGRGIVAVIEGVGELPLSDINRFLAVPPRPNGTGGQALWTNIADLKNWFNSL